MTWKVIGLVNWPMAAQPVGESAPARGDRRGRLQVPPLWIGSVVVEESVVQSWDGVEHEAMPRQDES